MAELLDVNRFRARYRAAHAFEDIVLDGYSEQTARGYSCMVRLTLTWSAFEFLLPLIGIPKNQRQRLNPLADRYDAGRVLAALDNDDCRGLFRYIYETLDDRRHRDRVAKFVAREAVNPVQLAAAIRHSFAHGHLAPSDRQEVTISTCNLLADLLFRIMDGEFEERVMAFHEDQLARQQQLSEVQQPCPRRVRWLRHDLPYIVVDSVTSLSRAKTYPSRQSICAWDSGLLISSLNRTRNHFNGYRRMARATY